MTFLLIKSCLGKQKFENTNICMQQDNKLVGNGCGFVKLSVIYLGSIGFGVKTASFFVCL